MENFLRSDEIITQKLCALFQMHGHRRVHVGKFEEYSLYLDNKDFLHSESVITFMDMDGRLLALRPDVTLSVVKGMPQTLPATNEKLYYVDEVYRASPESREYKVHSQAGVEIIGKVDGFTGAQALDLALSSLELISPDYVLDVSHLGFVGGLLETLSVDSATRAGLMSALYSKSVHELATLLEAAGEQERERVLRLSRLCGKFEDVLPCAKELVCGDAMAQAYLELERIGKALGRRQDRLRLDFSVVNSLDYYNGLIFQGYVKGIPAVVLSGGRYDNLLHKMGKKSGAVGFAVSLDELGSLYKTPKSVDFDVLLCYNESCDWAALLDYADALRKAGDSVRLEPAGTNAGEGLRYARRVNFTESGVADNA